MEVTGRCKDCGKHFDAHWHIFPINTDPICPVCKSSKVFTYTDETYGEDYYESPHKEDYEYE